MSWSYSKLSTYEQCPAKKKYKYDEKVDVEFIPSPAMERGSAMHGDLEHNLHRTIFDVPEWMRPHMPYLERYAEGMKEIKIWLDGKWQPVAEEERDLITIIDMLWMDGPRAEVIDWKSGKRYKGHIDQLELYCLSVLQQFPEVNIAEGKAYYLDEPPGSWGSPVFLARDNLKAVRDRWNGRVIMMDADTECAPRSGWYCKWCDFRKSNAGPCQFG